MRRLANNLHVPKVHIVRVPFAIDNYAALSLTNNSNQHKKAKQINRRLYFVSKGIWKVKHI